MSYFLLPPPNMFFSAWPTLANRLFELVLPEFAPALLLGFAAEDAVLFICAKPPFVLLPALDVLLAFEDVGVCDLEVMLAPVPLFTLEAGAVALGLLDCCAVALGLLDCCAVALGLLDCCAVALGLLDCCAVALGLLDCCAVALGLLDCCAVALGLLDF